MNDGFYLGVHASINSILAYRPRVIVRDSLVYFIIMFGEHTVSLVCVVCTDSLVLLCSDARSKRHLVQGQESV